MKILAIETSCDDTGIAVLQRKNNRFAVRSNIVSSQAIHQNYGGVFPMMAKREHQKNLVPVLTQALREAKLLQPLSIKKEIGKKELLTIKKILAKEEHLLPLVVDFLQTYKKPLVDSLAVTYGPGLEPCLWVGINFARVLSFYWDIPLIPVNHIEAHILVNFLNRPEVTFPALALVVSGGHTQLILMKKIGAYEIIGETRDDAAGECFDKAAKILGLGYPGGPIISNIASQITQSPILLPRPMISSHDYDFSFSGLKTAVLYKVRETSEKERKSKDFIANMCFAVQDSIIDVLLKKTFAAAKNYNIKIPTAKPSKILDSKAIGTIILGGGVSANQELKKQFTATT